MTNSFAAVHVVNFTNINSTLLDTLTDVPVLCHLVISFLASEKREDIICRLSC